ncbi:MAG: insulinase family protein [Oscillospiraceae bacterium]|jgi:predicted Zn-dependent peptidase|nr:insulinase family protein [Oscillospiraceae bacterium]
MKLKSYEKIREQIYSDRLPNGMPVFVVPKRGYNKSYAFFATDYGSVDRRFKYGGKWLDTPEGVAHFLEHKMFDTEDGNALTSLSANGASPNAFTSSDITAYHFESTEKFEENLEILLSFVSIPWFTPESVQKEQGIIAQEIRMTEDSPDHAVYYGLMKALFRHNPIRDSIAGTVDSIAGITSDTLYDCHRVFYNPSNMALCVTGDVDPERIVSIAARTLPRESGERPRRDYGPDEDKAPAGGGTTSSMEVSRPIFLLGAKADGATSGRDFLRRNLTGSLALGLLAGNSSPLYMRLYEEGLIDSDFSAAFETSAGVAYSMAGGGSREPEAVFAEFKKEADALGADGPDAELFSRVKKAYTGGLLRALNSFDSICYNCVSGYFRGYDAFESADVLESVTADDVREFIRVNLAPDNMAMSTITPKQEAAN